MVNWGIIKKDFKSYDPSAYDVDKINVESLEHIFGQESEDDIIEYPLPDDEIIQEESNEPEIEDEDRSNGETWESGEGYGAKNDKGQIQYFPTKQEATDWINKQDNNFWYVVAIVAAVIILLILFRSCNNNIANNDPKGRKIINSAEGKIKKTRTNNTVAKPNDTSTPSMATKRNKKNGVKKSEPGSNSKPNKKNDKRLRRNSDPDPPNPPLMSESDVMSRFEGKLLIPPEETNQPPSEDNGLKKIGEVWEDQSKNPAELYIKDNNNP